MFKYVAFLLPFFMMCTDFTSQYERIENDRIRLVDFVYEPPEAAPGDTVLLKAIFAGKEVAPEDITWRVSYLLGINSRGVDTVFDRKSLEHIVYPCSFSAQTHCIGIRFVIPHDCIKESPMVNKGLTAYIPDELLRELPGQADGFEKEVLVDLVDSLSQIAAAADSSSAEQISSIINSVLPQKTLPLIMQLLTAKIRIYADVKNSHRIKSDYTVNYNSRLSAIPGISHSDNRNPLIDSIGLYICKGADLQKLERDHDSTVYKTITKNGDTAGSTIEVKKGYTYFLEAFVSNRDSVITLNDIATNDPASMEEITAQWFFQMNEDEMNDFRNNDFMNIAPLNDLTATLYLPEKKEIRHFTIWVEATDSKINVLNRSQGSTVIEFHGEFSYPD